jgi:hypothetical protein
VVEKDEQILYIKMGGKLAGWRDKNSTTGDFLQPQKTWVQPFPQEQLNPRCPEGKAFIVTNH